MYSYFIFKNNYLAMGNLNGNVGRDLSSVSGLTFDEELLMNNSVMSFSPDVGLELDYLNDELMSLFERKVKK